MWISKDQQIAELKSFTDFMERKLEESISNNTDEIKTIKRRVLKRLLKSETAESGCATMDLCSIGEYGSYMVPHGPNYEFPGGFSKLITYLLEKLPETAIKLEHPVKRLEFLAATSRGDDEEAVLVVCSNGARFKAKHVVVTCSVNYLQKHFKTMFDPRLMNEKKAEAINTVKMGTVNKIFMFYGKIITFVFSKPAQKNVRKWDFL